MLQTCAHRPQIKPLFQISLRINHRTFSLRILAINNTRVKSICKKDNGTSFVYFFQQIRIQFCLLSSLGNVYAGTLCFNYREWSVHIIIKDIISKTNLRFIRHSRNFHLIEPVSAFYPACFCQHGIDIKFSRLILGQFQRFGNIRLLLFLTACGQFFPQRSIFCTQFFQIKLLLCRFLLFFLQSFFCCLRIFFRLFRFLYPCYDQCFVEGSPLILVGIAVCNIIEINKKIFQAKHRFIPSQFSAAVCRIISAPPNIIHPLPQVRPDCLAIILTVHQTLQVVLVRHLERIIHRIHPFHRKLHRPPAVQNTGLRVE